MSKIRAHSTGSEDNGLHVGIDGTWPETGRRLQWCAGKRTWRWESKQRTAEVHCGEPYRIYLDVEAGLHEHFKNTHGELFDEVNQSGAWTDEIEAQFKAGVEEFKKTGSW